MGFKTSFRRPSEGSRDTKKPAINVRLIVAIVTSLLDEAAILVVIIWLLPKMGIKLPLWGTVLLVGLFVVIAVGTYLIGSRALKMKPMTGLPDMVGAEGCAVTRLDPEGLVKISGELWSARSENGIIEAGCGIVVTFQNGLKLKVKTGPPPLGKNPFSG